MESHEFEFDTSQNELFGDLARKMGFVGLLFIALGALTVLGGVFGGLKSLSNLFVGVLYILIGLWTKNAADSFRRIVDTQGSDIANLMMALGQLRKLYTLQYWAIIISIIFVVLALILAILFATTR
ncbi:DUF5362 family protein [Trichothermofontia sp.]